MNCPLAVPARNGRTSLLVTRAAKIAFGSEVEAAVAEDDVCALTGGVVRTAAEGTSNGGARGGEAREITAGGGFVNRVEGGRAEGSSGVA